MQISIILPVFSETNSVIETVNEINTVIPKDYLKEIIIVVSPKSTEESVSICKGLAEQFSFIHCFMQNNNPGIGWAFREAFQRVQGSYVLMMASDGETDPKVIPLMIKKAQETGCDIVTGNRWTKGGGFEGYSFLKRILNYIFQRIMGIMYSKKISDYTYAYRLYKMEALKGHVWEETKHPFLLESLLRPLKKGFTVEQIPVIWHGRKEGESKNTFLQNFVYIRTAVGIYFEH
jgi:dolichol-phosphate mannosyltransferase